MPGTASGIIDDVASAVACCLTRGEAGEAERLLSRFRIGKSGALSIPCYKIQDHIIIVRGIRPCAGEVVFRYKYMLPDVTKGINGATFAHIEAELGQENFLPMAKLIR